MRQVHFAFRRRGEEYVAGHGTHAVEVDADGTVAVSPLHHLADRVLRGAPLELRTVAVARGRSRLDGGVVRRRRLPGGQLVLRRGGVEERLQNREAGVEQSWMFRREPAGAGDLVVRVEARGQRYLARSDSGLHFLDPDSGVGLRYGSATWIDADGRQTAVSGELVQGQIVLRVPERVVAGSSYPAVLDPVIAAEFGMDQPAHGPPTAAQQRPAVAFDGTNYLVAWQDNREGTTTDIIGTRVSAAGVVLDTEGIDISTANNSQARPAVAFGGGYYMVVWQDRRTGGWNIHGARVKPDGSVQDPNSVSISTANGDQTSPAVVYGGTDFLAVWQDKRSGSWDIYGARVSAAGNVLDTNGLTLSAAPSDQQEPAVAFDGTNYMVAWQDRRGLSDWDIYAARVSTSGGLIDSSGIAVALVTNNQQLPAMVFNGTDYLVVWQDNRNPGTKWDIFGSRVSTQGVVQDPLGIPVSQYDNDQNDQQEPAVAFDGTNHLVLWQDNRNGDWDIYAARVSTAGAVVDTAGNPFLVVSGLTGSQTTPAVAKGSSDLLAVWADYRTEKAGLVSSSNWDIYGTTISTGGAVTSSNGVPISIDLNDQQSPAVAFDGSSNYLVVWSDYRTDTGGPGWDIYAVRVDAKGTVLDPTGIAVSTATDDQIAPAVVFGKTQFLVVWQDRRDGTNWDVYGARVSTGGVVSDTGGIPVSQAAAQQQSPAVAHDGTNFLVAWQDNRIANQWDIYAARVNSSGTVLDTTGIAVSSAGSQQQEPAVAFDGTNYFVVWQDKRSGSNWDIYGARLSTAGSLLDPQGQVVSFASNDQLAPVVIHDGTQFIAVWEDKRSGTNWDIYAARINGQAQVQEANGITVSAATDDQRAPSAAHDGYSTVITWQDRRGGSNWDIYGSRLTGQGSVGDTLGFLVAGDPSDERAPGLAGNAAGKVLVAYYRGVSTTIYGTDRVKARLVVTTADNGTACGADIDCKSAHCVDGMCCNTACGGGVSTDCQACSVSAGASTDGTCGPVATGTVCRPTAGDCDVAESCDGTATTCPADVVESSTKVCRAATGACDVAESCDGVAPVCPTDAVEPSSTVCRAAAGDCDLAELCDGISGDCPADQKQPNGTACGGGSCQAGQCVALPDSGLLADAGVSDAKAGDAKAGDAKAGDAKVGDAKVGDAKAGDAKVSDAKAGDAKVSDAKVSDARSDAPCFGPSCAEPLDGCSCTIARRPPPGSGPAALLLLLMVAVFRRPGRVRRRGGNR